MGLLIRLGQITYHQIMRILSKALHLALRCRRSDLLRNPPSLPRMQGTGSTDLSLDQLESLHSLVGSVGAYTISFLIVALLLDYIFIRHDICKLECENREALLRDSVLR